MLVELERNFTSYEIEQVANLQSRYAMRLYECLIRFKGSKTLTISLDDLRFRFGLLDNEYKAMGDLKDLCWISSQTD
nr:RepB family plasmid replication initiator protein [Moraxella osloensis]